MKFYVVCWAEKDTVETKIYKNLKSAEKFGCRMMIEHNTSVNINTYISGNVLIAHITTDINKLT